MAITILDAAKARNVTTGPDGSISMQAFEELDLPFFSGCQCCQASLGPYNAYPSKTGFIRCADCVDELGFETVEEFEIFQGDV